MVDYGWMEMNKDGCKLRDLDEMDENGFRQKFDEVFSECPHIPKAKDFDLFSPYPQILSSH